LVIPTKIQKTGQTIKKVRQKWLSDALQPLEKRKTPIKIAISRAVWWLFGEKTLSLPMAK
jgi:hypothetical protein